MALTVCVDAQAAITSRSGVGRYVVDLIEGLARLPGDDRFRPFHFAEAGVEPAFSSAVERPAVCRWMPARAVRWSWKRLAWPPFDRFAPAADLYHFPNFIRPPLARGRSIVTVHDAAFLRHPGTVEEKNLRWLTSRMPGSLARADGILADSEFVANELREAFPSAADRITAVPLGVSDSWSRPPDDRIASTLARLGVTSPYLLTVGTIEPRKNHALLVSAFERLADFPGELVIAGRRGWKCDSILARFRESPVASRIRWLPALPDAELPALYAGAELFAFPSLYEGFGFPPLEAARCGTASIVAANGSLPEVLGDAADLVKEDDPDAWAERLERLLGDTEARAELARRAGARADGFTWERTARLTRDFYRKVAGSA